MADFTPEQVRRMHDFAEQLAELAEHQEDRWKVQTTDGQIFLTMMSPTAPHGLNVMRLRRQIEAQTLDAATLSDTNMGDPVTGLTKIPDLLVMAEEDTDDTAKAVNSRDVQMVVEVVSRTNSLTDIRDKLHDYPKMGVPLYVVVDPRKDKKTVTVHSDPSEGPDGIRYRKKVPYSFGDTVTAGRWTLDTSSLKSYPADW
ncbi:Uma2 family endonuclease [Streptomyces sp. NBC_01214]|uniref:Uma2 family endonuclease n=1 Tax=Streptomyces sp. NBC_01214 TaxID=2903777 RepID=UPI0022573799|nr:Uma2 family endonuclease [Streptomyces sp. NBC_01214]MCX4801194.1 Uma2 family endonuclease [Streptomyces sp. NBC_01214]